MIFLRSDYLLFMLLPIFVLFFLIITNQNRLENLFDKKILKKLIFNSDTLGITGRNLLLFASVIFMIIALARPVIKKAEITTKIKTTNIVVALDISKSMFAKDIYPNRFEFAKKRITQFIDKFPQANISIIAFSSDGFLVSPLTDDSSTLKYLLQHLNINNINSKGTNISIPLLQAQALLSKSKQKVVVIFTDGGEKKEFHKEINIAKKANEHTYIYATATPNGSPIKINNSLLKDKKNNIVISKLNKNIYKLALQTDGAYIQGSLSPKSIELLIKEIKTKLKNKQTKNKKIIDYKELFYYPLAISLILLLFAFSSFPRQKQKHITIIITLAIFSFEGVLKASFFDFKTIHEGKIFYKEENYKLAIENFRKVAISKKSPQAFYNLANALYKDRRYLEALQIYNKITTTNENLLYKKLFNSANALFKLKRYKEALKNYQLAKKFKIEQDLIDNIKLTKEMIKKENKKKSPPPTNKNTKTEKENKKNIPKKDKLKNKQTKNKNISKKEITKWKEQLEKSNIKTIPIKLKSITKTRNQNEKNW